MFSAEKLDILHIYPGASGTAATYVYELLKSSSQHNQFAIIGHSSRGERVLPLFYKYSSLDSKFSIRNRFFRLLIRYFELIFGLFFCYFFILARRPVCVNYAFTSHLLVEYAFIFFVRYLSPSKVALTCHDVIPFQTDYSDKSKDIRRRKMFFDISQLLVVHNNYSKQKLVDRFGISKYKI